MNSQRKSSFFLTSYSGQLCSIHVIGERSHFKQRVDTSKVLISTEISTHVVGTWQHTVGVHSKQTNRQTLLAYI